MVPALHVAHYHRSAALLSHLTSVLQHQTEPRFKRDPSPQAWRSCFSCQRRPTLAQRKGRPGLRESRLEAVSKGGLKQEARFQCGFFFDSGGA